MKEYSMDISQLTSNDVMWSNQSTDWLKKSCHALRGQLMAQYQKLPAYQQIVLQLMAVRYDAINNSDLNRSLKTLDVRDRNDQKFSMRSTTELILNLKQAGLVVSHEHSSQHMCHFLLTELLTRQAVTQHNINRFIVALQSNVQLYLPSKNVTKRLSHKSLYGLRCAIYRGDSKLALNCLTIFEKCKYDSPALNPLALIGLNPLDAHWLANLPDALVGRFYQAITRVRVIALLPLTDLIHSMEQKLATVRDNSCRHSLFIALSESYLMTGQHAAINHLLETVDHVEADAIRGCIALTRGEHVQAVALFQTALAHMQQQKGITKKQRVYFNTISAWYYLLALLASGDKSQLKIALEFLKDQPKHTMYALDHYYQELLVILRELYQDTINLDNSKLEFLCKTKPIPNNLFGFMNALLKCWFAPQTSTIIKTQIIAIAKQLKVNKLQWLEHQIPTLLNRLKIKTSANLVNLYDTSQWSPLSEIYRIKARWEHALDALSNLLPHAKAPHDKTMAMDKKMRLAWLISVHRAGCGIEPREQKLLKNGTWSKGRPIAIQRLYHNLKTFDYFTEQDRRICACIREEVAVNYYRYHEVSHYFEMQQALPELVGHPYLFAKEHPTRSIELATATPELRVNEVQDQVVITFHPPVATHTDDHVIEKLDARRMVYYALTDAQIKMGQILSKGLKIPKQALAHTQTIIGSLAQTITVHSDFDTDIGEAVWVEPVTKLHVLLSPADDGLQVRLLIKPFGAAGTYYQPGEGGKNLITEVNGQRLHTKRDLLQEISDGDSFVAKCPTLQQQTGAGTPGYDWLIEAPQDCFELVLQLQVLAEEVNIEWPEGEKFKVKRELSSQNWKPSIKRQHDWFHVSGNLQIDNNKMLDMQNLLALIAVTPGRFLPIGNNEFVALTHKFRQRLEALASYTEADKTGRRFAPVTALAIEDVFEDLDQVKADKHWRSHLDKIKSGETLVAEVPSTLTAELRDYQLEGYRWLARLAHWGVGACLADDMGLGKTLQALAYLVKQAPEGPSLVVAPTSVCMNWLDESARFAPTLKPILLHQVNDRAGQLKKLGPFDVLICSYGLLQIEVNLLADVLWQVIVLDEAQAIKNMHAKRAKAAMRLQGVFKIIMTGTPVENHLGELWNLFRFINPGLLGSIAQFTTRFAQEERQQDAEARQRLKRLIQPFVLRRLKSQVLKELPSRTEIAVKVRMEPDEAAFYEALRLRALQNLDNSNQQAGAKHVQVLAEITRLRRACCHPKLIMPDIGIDGAKFKAFKNIVSELIDNHHKALVFSQFVTHLRLLQTYLDEAKITYQYLDGSTPTNQRKRRVDAFQAGEGDIFLISLKAGGVGLNLTAADYVIHMDPWWNPAVEDQASDRAHRIGQQRPVTIYRMITTHTIEEQIVALHKKKRDLADSLLEGTDLSAKITTNELLKLLRS